VAKHDTFDVVVVGSGIAGLSAAVSAIQAGLRVAILERAPKEDYGGNTRWTESYMRMKSDSEVSDDFETIFAENAGPNLDPNVIAAIAEPYEGWPSFVKAHGLPDPEIISTFSEAAGPTLQWLKSFGIKFDHLPMYLLTVSAPRIMPIGGGLAMIEALSAYACAHGVKYLYEHTAYRLIVDDDGVVCGVYARNASGKTIQIHGKAVVLACGGFEGNPEMLARYIGRRAEFIRPVARGGYYNRGEGIRMGLDIGAAPAGDFGSYHAEPVDPRSRQPEALVMNYPYGILVNIKGCRFTDEAPGAVDNNYDHTTRRFAEQPNGIVYVIYDQSINDVKNWRRSIRTDQPAFEAASLQELAKKIGIPASALEATVRDYNAACPKGEFKPFEIDGLSTRDLTPPKSNWARPIDAAPFFAYPIISANCFTYGGLKINKKAQVLDCDGRPISGLMAAGETAGLYYQNYPGATSVLRGAVFGRIAAATVATLLTTNSAA